MNPRSRFLMMSLCAALAAAWASAAAAQTTAPATPRPAPQVQQPAPNYSEDELKTFAVAALEVLRINDLYLPKLKMAATPEEQQQVEKTATDEMVKAVQKQGLTVDKYKEIMTHAEANPEIADRVMKHMKAAQSSPGAGH
ncbi:MAG TPA: DUF4168 domain-containing protein [Burkholderiales bacterium]|nr:DUF4168 domain-containing protein [Burkholderiales bacterium]